MRKPNGSIDSIKKYYNDRLNELTIYFESNLDFYQYYRSKATHLDSHYFVTGHIDSNFARIVLLMTVTLNFQLVTTTKQHKS